MAFKVCGNSQLQRYHVHHLGFSEITKILVVGQVESASMHQCTKFHENQTESMTASAALGNAQLY